MVSLLDLARVLLASPDIAGIISLEDLQVFCDIIRWLKDEIAATQPWHVDTSPENLPITVHNFLMGALSLSDDTTKRVWDTFREIAWNVTPSELPDVQNRARVLLPLFLQHGVRQGLGFYNLRPPTRTCHDPRCAREYSWDKGNIHPRALGEPLSHYGTAFTRDFGPVPIRLISLYCRHCHTRYYHNFYLHDQASSRTYYQGVPQWIQVALHYFVSADVLEMFSNLMAISWTSATNCARWYNSSLAPIELAQTLPLDWDYSFRITTEQVWNGFFLYSLMLHHADHGTVLDLPHVADSQSEHIRPAIRARNTLMAGPGQEQWSHVCDLCCWITEDEHGVKRAIRSVVTDGVGIGHPCCGVHDCKEPLLRSKGARYCKKHASKEKLCSVLDCGKPCEKEFRTCADSAHRRLDEILKLENKAMFQLKERHDRLNTLQSRKAIYSTVLSVTDEQADAASRAPGSDPFHTEIISDGIDDGDPFHTLDSIRNDEVECDAKSPEGNKRIRALFGQKRTHNEELAVASCGMILGRATFFGSEAIGGVLEFWMILWPTIESVPELLWHDQNCRLWSTLQNADQKTREHFDHCALPVDVFHFKCKHKATDIVCGTHCNPYIWPELWKEGGKSRFNSSAAEETNVWIGEFGSIVRGMEVERYNFFLDEMIKRRNRETVKRLEQQGHRPYVVPREAWNCQ